MPIMKARFWGTRGSIATPGPETIKYGGNTSCVEIRAGEQILIMDAGTGIRNLGAALLKEFDKKPLKAHVFISHTHWDHIQGFPFFMPAYKEQNSINVYGPPGRARKLDTILRSQMDADFFPVSLGDMTATINVSEINETFNVGDVIVHPYHLNHPAMTLGYRLEYKGKSIVYATDNEPYEYTLHEASKHRTDELKNYGKKLDDDFVRFIANADLLIAEAQYTKEEYEKKIGWGHSPLEKIVEWASKGKVVQLALFHHDPVHEDADVDAMVAHAHSLLKRSGSATQCFGACEGAEIVVG
jgi:phosphoribosyl 1,2-cyclic phosphodiesterase